MNIQLEKIDEFIYKIKKDTEKKMRTDALLFSDESMLQKIMEDNSLQQLVNISTLPGIVGNASAMPDIHFGYGFPIGGVAAFDLNEGVVSPGGVGYDINCGVRLIKTDLMYDAVYPHIENLINVLFSNIPSGVSKKRKNGSVKLSKEEMDGVLEHGAYWAIENGMGDKKDLEYIEEHGKIANAEPKYVSEKAKERGYDQLGTIGSGNHFVEVQVVDEIYDENFAKRCGIFSKGQVMLMVHTGSRGLGHQIATDYISLMNKNLSKYKIDLVDRQLSSSPINSEEGQRYIASMRAGANFAWANREVITHYIRESFTEVFKQDYEKMGIELVYDIAHNIAKIEKHTFNGITKEVLVHRKGATRAFPANNENVPTKYRDIGQPVIIPGDMGTNSYLLYGLPKSMELSFGSTCHGAGRMLSRTAATKKFSYNEVKQNLLNKGIYVKSASKEGVVEEAPGAYKNVNEVVRVAEGAGLSKIAVKFRPIAVMKG
ncbi:MAG: RtcB family protein [Thermoplasmata archaeon]